MVSRSAGAIRVEGASRLRSTARKAADDLQDLKGAHAAAAGVVVPAAEGRAPKVSGSLAASGRGSGTKTMAVVRFGGAAVPYANPIHWGWPARGIPANPFVSEAAQATQPTWMPLYEHAVETVLDRIKGV